MNQRFISLNRQINENLSQIQKYKYTMSNMSRKFNIISQVHENHQMNTKNQSQQKIELSFKLKQLETNIQQILKVYDIKILHLNSLVEKLRKQLAITPKKLIQNYQTIIRKLQKQLCIAIDKESSLHSKISELQNKNSCLIQQFNQFSQRSSDKFKQIQREKEKAEHQKTNLSIDLEKVKKLSILQRSYQSHQQYQDYSPKKRPLMSQNYKYDYHNDNPKSQTIFGCIPNNQHQSSQIGGWRDYENRKTITNPKTLILVPDLDRRLNFLMTNLKDGQQSEIEKIQNEQKNSGRKELQNEQMKKEVKKYFV